MESFLLKDSNGNVSTLLEEISDLPLALSVAGLLGEGTLIPLYVVPCEGFDFSQEVGKSRDVVNMPRESGSLTLLLSGLNLSPFPLTLSALGLA